MTFIDSNDHSSTPLTDQSFMDLLDAYDYPAPREGDILAGKVLHLSETELLLNVGAKHTASVPIQEIRDLDGELISELSIGDEINVYVTQAPKGDDKLIVSVERILIERDWERAQEAFDNNEALELKIIGQNRGGLIAEFGRIQGFIPHSKMPELQRASGQRETHNIKQKLIGSQHLLQIIDIDRGRQRLVLSGTEAQDTLAQNELEALVVGQIVTGQITGIKPYGIFVTFGHLTGLCHISKLAHQQVEHPKALFTVGEKLEVMIETVDTEKGRVSLNRKHLLPNPYEHFSEKYSVGDLIEGYVQNTADFGTFIQLEGDIIGLMHINEMLLVQGSHPSEAWERGEKVLAAITSIDVERERIGLSQRKVDQDAQVNWMMANQSPPQTDDNPQDDS